MKHLFITIMSIAVTLHLSAQKDWYVGAAVLNTQPAYPFGKFTGLFKDALHPGIEISHGNNFSKRKKHDWFYEFRLGYFYHRYVQHGIPLTTGLGYRYHLSTAFSLETSLGAGFMKSIPAAEVFSQGTDALYHEKKGKGREQIIATYGVGGNYHFNKKSPSNWRLFATYQQRIQFPFIKSYVPILPYNSFLLGISKSIGKDKLKQARKVKKYKSPVDRLLIQKKSYPQD